MSTQLDAIRKRAEAYASHGTPGLHAPQDRATLLEALDAAQPQYLTDAELYSGNGDTDLPDDTFVESADGSVWRVEPDFGWDCVSSGSAVLSGPARLLVMGGQE